MHIQDCLEEILHLEDTDLAASLADASRLFSCKKRQLVAKPDACSDWIPFLVSGVIRGYLTDEKGRDITDCFLYRPGEAVLSLSILTASFPINFEAVTDCVLLSIPTLCMSPVSLSRLRGQLRKRGEEPPVKQSRLSEKSGLF